MLLMEKMVLAIQAMLHIVNLDPNILTQLMLATQNTLKLKV
jgi:hypothetical protein